jgi:hypothetical protein
MADANPDVSTFKVLRFSQAGHFNPSRLFRINGNLHNWNFPAVKGDVLIHGPHMVAQSVGSEWRNHHPYQETIHPNQPKGDRTK